MKNKILFYSNVLDKKLFATQYFYLININLLTDMGYQVNACNKIRAFLKIKRYDIAFLYFYKKSLFPCLIARLFHKKVYITGGLDDLNRKSTVLWRYIRQCLFFVGCYLFSTKSFIESTSDMENIFKIIHKDILGKLIFLPMCLNNDIENYSLKEKKEIMFTTICWFGDDQKNMSRKGVDKALFLFSELIKFPLYKNSRFYIIGKDGEKNVYLKEIIDKLNLHQYVIITDEISTIEKNNILSRSKYYFQLSKYEGFGLAALEALYFKNIIIHSNKGGLRDFVKNYGIIYEDDTCDFEQLYSKIINFDDKLLDDARDNIIKNYTYSVRKNKLLKIMSL